MIRSPHKDKDSREHFEMRVHKRLLDILEPSPKTVDSLQRLDLPAGVDIEIKIQQACTGFASTELGQSRRLGRLSCGPWRRIRQVRRCRERGGTSHHRWARASASRRMARCPR